MLPISPLLEQCLEQLPYASPTAVCWVFMHRYALCLFSVHRASYQEDFIIAPCSHEISSDSGISSAPVLDLDDETLDFEPQPGAIFINETCGDLGHGMETICGHHRAVVILKHIHRLS